MIEFIELFLRVTFRLKPIGYGNFLADLQKPLAPFDQLKEMDWDKRKIIISNAKILQQIAKYVILTTWPSIHAKLVYSSEFHAQVH